MKTLMYYLRMIIPTLLVIFILGGKPAKVKGQEPGNNEKKTCVIKVVKEKDGDMKLIVKKKKDGDSEADIYIIKSGSTAGKK